MKNVLIFISFALPSLWLQGQSYVLNNKQSSLEWSGKAAFNSYTLTGMINCERGELNKVDGEIQRVQLLIDMRSLSSEVSKLTRHLKSEDFFAVKDYPVATFTGMEINYRSRDSAVVTGDLQIRGVSASQQIPFSISSDTDGGLRITGVAIVDRTKFGIYYNSPNYFKNLKQNAISDEFRLAFDLVFTPSPAADEP